MDQNETSDDDRMPASDDRISKGVTEQQDDINPFGSSWQARIKENTCCVETEKYLKKSYKINGGAQANLGDAGLDGTGTTLAVHTLLESLRKVGAISSGTSITDLGSGTGVWLMHAALFCEGKCIGIELSNARVSTSLIDLRNITNAVCCFPLLLL
jgi:hypothetical protein